MKHLNVCILIMLPLNTSLVDCIAGPFWKLHLFVASEPQMVVFVPDCRSPDTQYFRVKNFFTEVTDQIRGSHAERLGVQSCLQPVVQRTRLMIPPRTSFGHIPQRFLLHTRESPHGISSILV